MKPITTKSEAGVPTNNRQTQSEFALTGKLPPQALELEETVIGALMIESKAIESVEAFLIPEVFYREAHQKIYQEIQNLRKDNLPIDILTVSERLRKSGLLDSIGGAYYLATLTNTVGSSANIETHARILFEKWVNRELIRWGSQLVKEAYEDRTDIFELQARYEKEWAQITGVILNGHIPNLGWQVDAAVSQIERQMANDGAAILSKHYSVNKHFGGWQKQTVNIIAARPAMGKSAFITSEIMFQLTKGYKIAVFNLEMSPKQFFSRCLCNYSGVSNQRSKTRNFYNGEELRWYEGQEWLKQQDDKFTVIFDGGLPIEEIVMRARKLKQEKGLDIIYIDYLQLISVPNLKKTANREQEIAYISRELKSLSKNEDVAIVALAALNREVENRADKRPSLSSLRESGAIESDADTVSFLLRPEVYFKKDSEGMPIYENAEHEAYRNICQFLNEKNRDDRTFADEFKCDMGTSCFQDKE